MATLDGSPVFGPVSIVKQIPRENAQQMNAFFGVTGEMSLFGGGRGRTFEITGMFVGSSVLAVNAAEAALLSYADGEAHTLVDNRGNSWENVIFKGNYQPDDHIGFLAGGGYCLKFRCILVGLT